MDHWKLLKKQLKGTLKEKQRQQFQTWLDKDSTNLELFQEIEANWKEATAKDFKSKAAFKRMKKRIEKGDIAAQRRVRSVQWAVAASFAIMVGASLLFVLTRPEPEINYLTKSTDRGQKATITLSDGSTVRLNAESSITYPESFTTLNSRDIVLIGEAFFDVERNPEKPFKIKSGDVLTTVLGTSFNINAYDSSEVCVALVSGKVKVNAAPDNSSFNQSEVYLNPGESAFYDGQSGDIKIGSFDEKKLVAWKDGIIYLSNAGYKQVFDQLSQWYGVDFEFVNAPTEQWDYSGEFEDMSLELVLSTIGYSKGFEFQIRDIKVRIEFENQ